MAWAPWGAANQPRSDGGFDLPGGESTAAALRRAEQERDELSDLVDKISAELTRVLKERDSLARRCAVRFEETAKAQQERDEALAEVSGVRASLAELADEVEDLKGTLAMRTGQLKAATRERDLARAELASAQQEIEHLRAQVASKSSYIDELIAERDRLIAHLRDVMT